MKFTTILLVVQPTAAFMVPAPDQTARRMALFQSSSGGSNRGSLGEEEATSSTPLSPLPTASATLESREPQEQLQEVGSQVVAEAKEIYECVTLMAESLLQKSVSATDIVECCDALDQLKKEQQQKEATSIDGDQSLFLSENLLDLRRRALEFKRYHLLATLLSEDYDVYVATASFLSPSRIPRMELPNIQDIPYDKDQAEALASAAPALDENGRPLVADCELQDMEYNDNPLDVLLLKIFRELVTEHTGGVTSEKPGIDGLLEQGRTFMLQPNQTPEAQHQMVYNTLKSLMTPVLPPFYRIFMSGIVPNINSPLDGKQFGPWFYAPFLTSFVTPVFFAFLVGPSRVNRRKDGALGGLVVEKCKFLQESGCKGLCLHQCKLPAQKFFAEELGLPLTVTPNFATQECQWSFGEEPLPPSEDPAFPDGCLSGCSSRSLLADSVGGAEAGKVDLCNYAM